ncbi:MAG: TetR/AcrR family transcriptional regulator [Pseudomonadota bacterium]
MARPREFDEIEAMDSAVHVFLNKGYEAASLMDLLGAMKLSKSSLYNSFGTKHELFLSALDHYIHNNEKKLNHIIEAQSTSREKIEAILLAVMNEKNDDSGRGCFLHNSAIEVLPEDALALEKIQSGLSRFKEIYIPIIEEGQRNGEISSQKSADSLADFLLCTILGFRSFARAITDEQRLKNLISLVVDTVCQRP